MTVLLASFHPGLGPSDLSTTVGLTFAFPVAALHTDMLSTCGFALAEDTAINLPIEARARVDTGCAVFGLERGLVEAGLTTVPLRFQEAKMVTGEVVPGRPGNLHFLPADRPRVWRVPSPHRCVLLFVCLDFAVSFPLSFSLLLVLSAPRFFNKVPSCFLAIPRLLRQRDCGARQRRAVRHRGLGGGDGCSCKCTADPGFYCSGSPSTCATAESRTFVVKLVIPTGLDEVEAAVWGHEGLGTLT